MCMGILLPIAFAAMAWSSSPVHAATYRVGSGAGCTHATIQAAINAAVATAADDEIRISGNWGGQALSINAAEGAITLAGGYSGCTVATPVAGARSVLTGNNISPVLRINASNAVSLRSLEIQGGRSTDNGGGIRYTATAAATFVLEDSFVRNNNAVAGGGLSIENSNPLIPPDHVRVQIRGVSGVVDNTASGSGISHGGGIHCVRAAVDLSGWSRVSQNRANAHGGGVFADNCKIAIGSRGFLGAVLWENQAGGFGGGLLARGALANVDIYTVDATQPARVVGNTAWHGGGLAFESGASGRLFDVNVEQNTATSIAGGVLVDASESTSKVLLQGGVDGAPAGATACDDPEACNRIVGNRSSASGWGAALDIRGNADQPLAAQAVLRGTRLEGNVGGVLISVWDGLLALDGVLMVGNTVSSRIISGIARIDIVASTIAGNALPSGAGVMYVRGDCASAEGGTRVERSIVFQPGHAVASFDKEYSVQPECFRHLMASDFGALPASAERVVNDPVLLDPPNGDYRPAPGSPALDFAPAHVGDATRNRSPRVIDLADAANRFGTQDLGAYERITDVIFRGSFD